VPVKVISANDSHMHSLTRLGCVLNIILHLYEVHFSIESLLCIVCPRSKVQAVHKRCENSEVTHNVKAVAIDAVKYVTYLES